jgi:hypothetical protein
MRGLFLNIIAVNLGTHLGVICGGSEQVWKRGKETSWQKRT